MKESTHMRKTLAARHGLFPHVSRMRVMVGPPYAKLQAQVGYSGMFCCGYINEEKSTGPCTSKRRDCVKEGTVSRSRCAKKRQSCRWSVSDDATTLMGCTVGGDSDRRRTGWEEVCSVVLSYLFGGASPAAHACVHAQAQKSPARLNRTVQRKTWTLGQRTCTLGLGSESQPVSPRSRPGPMLEHEPWSPN